jgi:hypothetical protein
LVVPDLMRHIALFAVHPAIQTMLPGFGASARRAIWQIRDGIGYASLNG